MPDPKDPVEADENPVRREESRAAVDQEETVQDFESGHKPAESRTSFGDDSVTPRLNDGR